MSDVPSRQVCFTRVPHRDYLLASEFEAIRRELVSANLGSWLDRPVGFWASSDDRYLPRALLALPLREIAASSFEALRARPGVGPRKFAAFNLLLRRPLSRGAEAAGRIDVLGPERLSRAQWDLWRQTVCASGFERCKLGTVVTCLRGVPRNMWNDSLSVYARESLDVLLTGRRFGRKRLTAVADAFAMLHAVGAALSGSPPIQALVRHQIVNEVEQWVQGWAGDAPIGASDLNSRFVSPLIELIAYDVGDEAARIAHTRIYDGALSLQAISRQRRLSRSRLYRILDDIVAAIAVRWPAGHGTSQRLKAALSQAAPNSDGAMLYERALACFFGMQHAGSSAA